MSQAPIGIFDSGLGGLSVWQACRELLPREQLIYVADHAYCPYGGRTSEEIQSRSVWIVDFLRDAGAKLILVACNTATAAAITALREAFAIPFVGMEPALKPAALSSRTKSIGILATKGTFRGALFQNTKAMYAAEVEVLLQVGDGLVELVESGIFEGEQAEKLLWKYLQPMQEKDIDQLVLGCTHYPFLTKPIQKLLGETVVVIDPAPAVARQVKRVLEKRELLSATKASREDVFYTTANPETYALGIEKIGAQLGRSMNFQKLP